MKVGFTGTREGMSLNQIAHFIPLVADVTINGMTLEEFHHGMCIGADEQAEEFIRRCFPSVRIVGHPPIQRRYISAKSKPDRTLPPREYIARNHKIVDSVDLLIGCPRGPEELRSGTWSTIRYATSCRLKRPSLVIKLIPR